MPDVKGGQTFKCPGCAKKLRMDVRRSLALHQAPSPSFLPGFCPNGCLLVAYRVAGRSGVTIERWAPLEIVREELVEELAEEFDQRLCPNCDAPYGG